MLSMRCSSLGLLSCPTLRPDFRQTSRCSQVCALVGISLRAAALSGHESRQCSGVALLYHRRLASLCDASARVGRRLIPPRPPRSSAPPPLHQIWTDPGRRIEYTCWHGLSSVSVGCNRSAPDSINSAASANTVQDHGAILESIRSKPARGYGVSLVPAFEPDMSRQPPD